MTSQACWCFTSRSDNTCLRHCGGGSCLLHLGITGRVPLLRLRYWHCNLGRARSSQQSLCSCQLVSCHARPCRQLGVHASTRQICCLCQSVDAWIATKSAASHGLISISADQERQAICIMIHAKIISLRYIEISMVACWRDAQKQSAGTLNTPNQHENHAHGDLMVKCILKLPKVRGMSAPGPAE